MTREVLEHIFRASADITNQYEFVIIGSQSMLGAVPRPEPEFTVSMEADIYPLLAPDLADRIDGAIGEGSEFHRTYGYYAQGVGPETATLPDDWMDRVHRVQNGNTWKSGLLPGPGRPVPLEGRGWTRQGPRVLRGPYGAPLHRA